MAMTTTRLLTALALAPLLFAACASSQDADAPRETGPPPQLARDVPPPAPSDGGEQTDPTLAPPDVGGPPTNAQRLQSGLATRVLRAGTGTSHPSERDRVEVHYSGWTTDGRLFDSSYQRGTPATFPVNGVIAGFREGLTLMVTGEKRRLWIPANLAYGDSPKGGAPAGMLVFDVELLGIVP
ncbi:MAG: FKBP-type peptidyl-prolyl cis-trans isomerase [Myxococcales bacterium]|nr:FKBP-type peptidyl-prolyl cis-trans isomerase [Myxococcales bacterium]